MNISLIFLGTTGAGPVYSLEMAKAISNTKRCNLQVIISRNVSNLNQWKEAFENNDSVIFHVIETYKHTTLDVIKSSLFDKKKKNDLIRLISNFKSDILYVPFNLLWAKDIYPNLNGVRIITTIHDPHPHDSFFKGFKWFLFNNFIGKECISLTNDIILLNRTDVDYISKKYSKPILVIPHASFSYYVKEKSDYTKKNKIGFFGRIEPYKGLDLLVDAFESLKIKNIKLLIAGSGIIDSKLKSRIKSNPNIELINRYIEDDEFQFLINEVDFVVLPYRRASQSGVIPMSFAFGKTVIATNVGALQEQVPDGTGLVVPPTSQSISKAIEQMYKNPDKIVVMGKTAYAYAKDELSWEHSALLLLDYLKNNEYDLE